jgi:hypothetical protein
MTDNKKATGAGKLQAASKSFSNGHFNPVGCRIKATIYRLAPWLFFVGVLHG